MKTVTTISAMPSPNIFRIPNVEDYCLIEVTASEGEHKVSMSFPWAHSIPYMDVSVQDAVKKCASVAQDSLAQHLATLAQKEARMTLVEKFFRFLRREFAYFWGRGKIGVDNRPQL
mgnify:CR=1 FL=1